MSAATATRTDEFTDFVRGHSAVLMRSACLIAGDRGKGEDLFQEALVRAYVKWDSIDQATGVAYIRRIMVNLATDLHRRAGGRGAPLPLDDARAVASGPTVADPYRAVDDRDDIVHRLGVLNARERAIVVTRYYFDLSEAATADQLGVSVGTIKSTCSRALAKMRAASTYPGGAR